MITVHFLVIKICECIFSYYFIIVVFASYIFLVDISLFAFSDLFSTYNTPNVFDNSFSAQYKIYCTPLDQSNASYF